MKKAILVITLLVLSFNIVWSKKTHNEKGGILYGYSRKSQNKQKIIMPLKKTDVKMKMVSGILQTNVRQYYENNTNDTLETVYIFPLSSKATITDMEMIVNNRLIKSEVQEKKEARRTYERAKKTGYTTSLMEQQRENIFTTNVANVRPNDIVIISFTFIEKLSYQKGMYEVTFPMVVGQRYIPYEMKTDDQDNIYFSSSVRDAQHINPPLLPQNMKNAHLLSLELEISGMPVDRCFSSTHSITQEKKDDKFLVKLRKGSVTPDSDFDLKIYLTKSNEPQFSVMRSTEQDEDYSLLTIFPPTKKQLIEQKKIPRDVVFLIDTSGSMSGSSIGQAQSGLIRCLDMLNPEDSFTIVRFASEYSYFSPDLRIASPQKLQEAKEYVNNLQAGGGTEMQQALDYVLDLPKRDNTLSMIIFLTDGCVGNEETLFRLLAKKLGSTRLFTFAIGSAPNEYLMRKMAEKGHGQFNFIHSQEDISEVMSNFFITLNNPVLTDISLSWKPRISGISQFPKLCPDVFYERPLQVYLKTPKNYRGTCKIIGRTNNKDLKYEYRYDPQESEENSLITKLCAREEINDLMYHYIQNNHDHISKQKIIEIALKRQLITNFTSRVAVEFEIKNERNSDGSPKLVKIPANLPKGWDPRAFGSTATDDYLYLLIGIIIFSLSLIVFYLGKKW